MKLQLEAATPQQIALFKLGAASVYQQVGLPPVEADRRFNAILGKLAEEMVMDSAKDPEEPAAKPKEEAMTKRDDKPAPEPKEEKAPVESDGEKAASARKEAIRSALRTALRK